MSDKINEFICKLFGIAQIYLPKGRNSLNTPLWCDTLKVLED